MVKYREGFAMPAPQICPSMAISSFPAILGFSPITETRYNSVSEPLTMDFQWASRTTPPLFVSPKATSTTDEVGAGNTNISTLRFSNNTYRVSSVQIIKSSHTSWILPVSSQAHNMEDMIIIFSSIDTAIMYPHITFVIPIIRGGSAANPSYLVGLSDPNSNGPFSIESCFPTNKQSLFAYYATCLAGYSGNAATQNMYVFIATSGIQVSSALMTKIIGLTGTNTFGNFAPPFMSRLSSVTKTINDSEFANYVMSTNHILNYDSFLQMYPSIDTGLRQDDASAYKCTPIDPDSDIQDGKIQVDIKSGEVLTDVMKKRAAVRASNNVASSSVTNRLDTHLGSALGIVMIIMFCIAVIYGIASVVLMQSPMPIFDPDTGEPLIDPETNEPIFEENPAFTWAKGATKYLIVALVVGFIGIIIGLTLS
jgi:hypothetical protein